MAESERREVVGVIGAGSFGTAIANLLAHNVDVCLYSRQPQRVERINSQREELGFSERISATSDLQELVQKCTIIFPIVNSNVFREVIRNIAPFLKPYHILIHGTKGFDLNNQGETLEENTTLTREQVHTMSEVILQETVVKRVGCLSGPNLASEIMDGQPTATVVGSRFNEVIMEGKRVLSSKHFHVFGTHDILGAELAGALKNSIAIGSGILGGKGMGKNIQAMLITRGLIEMVHFGKAMGATSKAFFGTAGVGDLVATATSKNSRNYTFGYRLGIGDSMEAIIESMPERAEGLRTLEITYLLSKYYKLRVPITQMLYNVVFKGFNIERAIDYLITYPYDVDVDFL